MSNTTTRHVLGSSQKAVATAMNAMYPNQPYTYINTVEKWVLLTEYERLAVIFSNIDWATTNRALATIVVKFFKDYIKSNPDQDTIDMRLFDKFMGIEDLLKQQREEKVAEVKVERVKTNSIYPRSLEFILSVLPKRTEDLIIQEASLDTPTDGYPTMTLTVMLPMRNE